VSLRSTQSWITKSIFMASESGSSPALLSKPEAVVFFDRKSLDSRKRRPKPIVYQVYLCSRCLESEPRPTSNQVSSDSEDEADDNLAPSDEHTEARCEVGAWAALIQRCPQDNASAAKQTVYMASGIEEAETHIQIRLRGLKEVMLWITADVEPANWSYVEATLVSSDVFLVNLLREWLPRWARSDFALRTPQEAKRPHAEILSEIAAISTRIKLDVLWQPDHSHEMEAISDKVEALLREAETATHSV
jgi:hypothetical protein